MFCKLGLVVFFLFVSSVMPFVQAQQNKANVSFDVTPYIEFHEGYLSVKVDDISVTELLEDIARQGNFTLKQTGELHKRITVEFYALPLWQGLQRILRRNSFVLQHVSPALGEFRKRDSRPQILWLFNGAGNWSTSSVNVLIQHDPEAMDFAQAQNALSSGDLAQQQEAIAFLGDSGLVMAVAPLSEVLLDGSETMREAAIAALSDLGGTQAVHALATALVDQQPGIREEAVYALADIGGPIVMRYLQQALMDSDISVRQTAQLLLEGLTLEER